MAGDLVCPECDCGSREHALRFDTDIHVGVIVCTACKDVLMAVSVLANKNISVVSDPVAPELPEGILYELEKEGRLPPAAKGDHA
jgi:hypothetical protein